MREMFAWYNLHNSHISTEIARERQEGKKNEGIFFRIGELAGLNKQTSWKYICNDKCRLFP